MKALIAAILICLLMSFRQQTETTLPSSPLSIYSSAWNDPKYLSCNTAAKANYLTSEEKELIYILNLARTNPKLFANTVIKKYPDISGRLYLRYIDYYTSLLDTMKKIKPLKLLRPDSLNYISAFCHAVKSGEVAYVGHIRTDDECRKKTKYSGECCQYGFSKPIDIIMGLLIDEGVPSLGHRDICLSSYIKIGVSIQPHKGYGYNAVLDFGY